MHTSIQLNPLNDTTCFNKTLKINIHKNCQTNFNNNNKNNNNFKNLQFLPQTQIQTQNLVHNLNKFDAYNNNNPTTINLFNSGNLPQNAQIQFENSDINNNNNNTSNSNVNNNNQQINLQLLHQGPYTLTNSNNSNSPKQTTHQSLNSNSNSNNNNNNNNSNNNNNNSVYNNNFIYNNNNHQNNLQSLQQPNCTVLAWMDSDNNYVNSTDLLVFLDTYFQISIKNSNQKRSFTRRRAQWIYFWLQSKENLDFDKHLTAVWPETWFDPFVNGAVAEKRLAADKNAFIVRLSSSKPGCFAISFCRDQIEHHYAQITPKGIQFENKYFESLAQLIHEITIARQNFCSKNLRYSTNNMSVTRKQ
eukprot:TRINITY_DN6148_c0_g3_i1.p1 TRINITY_DN6148_c0_g3~~TRINITY_DN6148_c0_g3_i1.p1  ORF type:complete len:360 (-),score=152.68 TRINITY_DN6148_c0_g3_i1:254-1333(-)